MKWLRGFDWKLYAIMLLTLSVVFFAVSFAQLPYLFENGEYGQYTVSLLQDQDLNLVNQVKVPELNWIVSQTGNHAAHRLYGISAYLLPFFAYQQFALGPASDINDYRFAQALSTVFYIFLGLIVLWKVLSMAGVKKLKTSFIILSCSTSFLWYFFFMSSSTNIFSLAFSLLAFSYFYLTIQKSVQRRHYFIFGMLLGLGLLIRIQLYWLGLVPLLFLMKDRSNLFRKVILFASGLLSVQAVSWVNSFIRNGHTADFPFLFFWKNFSLDLFLQAVGYSVWGPNGYLTVSPIYIGLFLLAFWIVISRKKIVNKDLANSVVLFLLAPLGIFIAQSSIGQLQDCLAGRHLLSYFFIYWMLLALFLNEVHKSSQKGYRILLFVIFSAVAWNLVATASFYYRDTVEFWLWHTSYQVSLENAVQGLQLFSSRAAVAAHAAQNVLVIFFPVLILLTGILYVVWKSQSSGLKKVCLGFFSYGVVTLAAITGCNFINNTKNVSEYTQQGLYDSKVVAKSTEALLYDDFIEMHRMSMRYYAHIGRCDLVQKSSEVIHRFTADISEDILRDPVGFKELLSQGRLRKSGLEDKETLEAFENEMKIKCPMLVRNTL